AVVPAGHWKTTITLIVEGVTSVALCSICTLSVAGALAADGDTNTSPAAKAATGGMSFRFIDLLLRERTRNQGKIFPAKGFGNPEGGSRERTQLRPRRLANRNLGPVASRTPWRC